MANDPLTQTWNQQKKVPPLTSADHIIRKANQQRYRQFTGIAVMSITVLILLIFSIYFISNLWNNFTLGLVLMIASLTFRIILEFISLYRKESQLVSLDNPSYKKYLKRHYKTRLQVNYIITPICFAVYIFGFTRLLPYFRQEFSEDFYRYILISGFTSLLVVALIIAYSTIKENNFLKQLNRK